MRIHLPYGPFESQEGCRTRIEERTRQSDPWCYEMFDRTDQRAVGFASYRRIKPTSDSMGLGYLNFSPLRQHTPAATESISLMMERAFIPSYRRLEWKCDDLNRPSRSAAQRLGFSFESIFRQATVVKGRIRDTAWFALLTKSGPRWGTPFIVD